ncbi:MAG: hypothetical protein QXH07_01290 [Thermoplasmata archaeon]
MPNILEWANKYVSNGIKVLPVTRKPLRLDNIINVDTTQYTAIKPLPNVLESWFKTEENNIAIQLGKDSDNLIAVVIEDLDIFNKYVPHTTTNFFNTFTTQYKKIRTYYYRFEGTIDNNLEFAHILPHLNMKIYINGAILAPPSIIDTDVIEAITDLNITTIKKINEFIIWFKNIDKCVWIINILKDYPLTEDKVYAIEEYAKIAEWDDMQISMLLDMIEQTYSIKKGAIKPEKLDYIHTLGSTLTRALRAPFGMNFESDMKADICFEWAPSRKICYDTKYRTFYETIQKYNKKDNEYYDLRTDLIYAGLTIKDCVFHDGVPKIRAIFNDIEYISEIEEWMRILGNSLRGTRDDNKKIRMFFQKYIEQNIEHAEEYHSDPIWVNDQQIHVETNNNIEVKVILTKLRELYDITTNQTAFITVLGWSLFAPLSYYFRSNGRPVPFLVLSGRSGGKTELLALFIAKGYGQKRSLVVIGENSILTEFTSMKTLGDSTLPILFDDISLKYLVDNADWFKSIYLHSEAGKRGKSDQSVITYFNKRNIAFTCNEEVVFETAEQERFIIEYYSITHKLRENSAFYYTFVDQLPNGFMLPLFRDIFDNKKLGEVINEMWYNLQERSMFNWRIIEYCITKINMLCKQYNIPEFPLPPPNISQERTSIKHDWAEIIFQKLYNDWQLLTSLANNSGSRSTRPILTEYDFNVSEDISSIRIDLTKSGYEKIKKDLRYCPYNTLTDLLNNVDPNNMFLTLKWSTHRFEGLHARTMAFIKDIKKENEYLEKIEKNEKELERATNNSTNSIDKYIH